MRAIPGVAQAGVSLNTPVNRGVTAVSDFTVPGGPDLPRAERRVIVNLVTPGWFETYGITLRAGRVIDRRDAATGPLVAVVNDAFVQKFFPGRTAVGQIVINAIGGPDMAQQAMTIVGVVENAVDQSLRSEAFPTLYQPLVQFTVPIRLPEFSLSVRAASGSPALLARSVSSTLTGVDRNLTFSFQPLADQVSAARQQERLVAWLSGFFGGLALLLAAIGLHGVTSYTVDRRRVEIGIRMALGAQRHDVVGLALGQTLVMALCGVGAGLAVAAALTRYLQTLFSALPLLIQSPLLPPPCCSSLSHRSPAISPPGVPPPSIR